MYFIDSNNPLLHKSVRHMIIAVNAHARFNSMVRENDKQKRGERKRERKNTQNPYPAQKKSVS